MKNLKIYSPEIHCIFDGCRIDFEFFAYLAAYFCACVVFLPIKFVIWHFLSYMERMILIKI